MRREFERFGLARFRLITGMLQLAAATGLLLGLLLPWISILASGGLALQMSAGLMVRIKIGDSLLQCFPALFYFILSSLLVLHLVQQL